MENLPSSAEARKCINGMMPLPHWKLAPPQKLPHIFIFSLEKETREPSIQGGGVPKRPFEVTGGYLPLQLKSLVCPLEVSSRLYYSQKLYYPQKSFILKSKLSSQVVSFQNSFLCSFIFSSKGRETSSPDIYFWVRSCTGYGRVRSSCNTYPPFFIGSIGWKKIEKNIPILKILESGYSPPFYGILWVGSSPDGHEIAFFLGIRIYVNLPSMGHPRGRDIAYAHNLSPEAFFFTFFLLRCFTQTLVPGSDLRKFAFGGSSPGWGHCVCP